MREFYPELQPYARGRLRVSELHEIYYEECGNPKGKPVVVLHGGPGGGISPFLRRLHDPKLYRIILFDQRGCGQSTPHAELRENTTWHLVADMEALRVHLGIETWQVLGGSWGSTLALAYAQKHAERVTELILRGIFAIRKREIDWFYQEGASALFPDVWETYLAPIPAAERGDLVAAYYQRLTGDDSAGANGLRQGLEPVGSQHAFAAPQSPAYQRIRRGCLCLGLCPHRVPLLRQQGLL